MIRLLILLALVLGGFGIGTAVGMRPANTPHVHYVLGVGPIRLLTIDWTAPESAYAIGLAKGAALQKAKDNVELSLCVRNNKYLKEAVDAQNAGAQAVEDAKLAKARAALQMAQAARLGRERTTRSAYAIDHFRGSGSSCEQAEQLVRSVIK